MQARFPARATVHEPLRVGSRRRGRAALTWIAATVAALTTALGTASGSAVAAEAGIVVPGPGDVRVGETKALGTHWVRMFLTWPDIEPARGVYAANWIAAYEQAFSQLPAGTKVLLDVVDSPQWETGSSSAQSPPANPQDYAAMLGMLASRFGGRVAA
jgi:hypothetical protein